MTIPLLIDRVTELIEAAIRNGVDAGGRKLNDQKQDMDHLRAGVGVIEGRLGALESKLSSLERGLR